MSVVVEKTQRPQLIVERALVLLADLGRYRGLEIRALEKDQVEFVDGGFGAGAELERKIRRLAARSDRFKSTPGQAQKEVIDGQVDALRHRAKADPCPDG